MGLRQAGVTLDGKYVFSVSKTGLDTDCISLYLEAASLYLPPRMTARNEVTNITIRASGGADTEEGLI